MSRTHQSKPPESAHHAERFTHLDQELLNGILCFTKKQEFRCDEKKKPNNNNY